MRRFGGWFYVVALVLVSMALISPSVTGGRAAEARDTAMATLEQVIEHARTCECEGCPVTRESLNTILAHEESSKGQVKYVACMGVAGRPKRWVVWAEPTVGESWLDRARPWVHATTPPRLCVRSWQIDRGVQEEDPLKTLGD